MSTRTVVPIGLKVQMDDRMKVALNAMPVAVSWTRLDDGHVEFMNQRFIDLFGYHPQDACDVGDLIRKTFADRRQADRAVAMMEQIRSQVLLDPFELPSEVVPVISRTGLVVPTRFSGVVLPEANMSLAMFQDISAEKDREARLAAIASQDPLTGLHNRRYFDAEFAQTLKLIPSGESIGLIVMDIDGLKPVNDTAGHQAGDAVLRHFAGLLRSTFRRTDLLGRWGGDEFAVLIRHPCTRADVAVALSRLEKALTAPIMVESRELRIGVSSGMAFYPDDALDIFGLYEVADAEMYRSKRAKSMRGR